MSIGPRRMFTGSTYVFNAFSIPPVLTVLVTLAEGQPSKRPLREVLGEYQGGRLFRTAEEVDAYLREERDSWDR